jgi:hypothetical protein
MVCSETAEGPPRSVTGAGSRHLLINAMTASAFGMVVCGFSCPASMSSCHVMVALGASIDQFTRGFAGSHWSFVIEPRGLPC